jgi:hypothetical protein
VVAGVGSGVVMGVGFGEGLQTSITLQLPPTPQLTLQQAIAVAKEETKSSLEIFCGLIIAAEYSKDDLQ